MYGRVCKALRSHEPRGNFELGFCFSLALVVKQTQRFRRNWQQTCWNDLLFSSRGAQASSPDSSVGRARYQSIVEDSEMKCKCHSRLRLCFMSQQQMQCMTTRSSKDTPQRTLVEHIFLADGAMHFLWILNDLLSQTDCILVIAVPQNGVLRPAPPNTTSFIRGRDC